MKPHGAAILTVIDAAHVVDIIPYGILIFLREIEELHSDTLREIRFFSIIRFIHPCTPGFALDLRPVCGEFELDVKRVANHGWITGFQEEPTAVEVNGISA
jgi:hypothetical protein